MPNQLAISKRRQSLAEHEAVLDALTEIARREKTSVMDLLREATRKLVKERVANPDHALAVRAIVQKKAPQMPPDFRAPAEVARYKRAQREFDQVLLDLGIETPDSLQQQNAIAGSRHLVRLIDFEEAHADTQ